MIVWISVALIIAVFLVWAAIVARRLRNEKYAEFMEAIEARRSQMIHELSLAGEAAETMAEAMQSFTCALQRIAIDAAKNKDQ